MNVSGFQLIVSKKRLIAVDFDAGLTAVCRNILKHLLYFQRTRRLCAGCLLPVQHAEQGDDKHTGPALQMLKQTVILLLHHHAHQIHRSHGEGDKH